MTGFQAAINKYGKNYVPTLEEGKLPNWDDDEYTEGKPPKI